MDPSSLCKEYIVCQSWCHDAEVDRWKISGNCKFLHEHGVGMLPCQRWGGRVVHNSPSWVLLYHTIKFVVVMFAVRGRKLFDTNNVFIVLDLLTLPEFLLYLYFTQKKQITVEGNTNLMLDFVFFPIASQSGYS